MAITTTEVIAGNNGIDLKAVKWSIERFSDSTGEWTDAYSSEDRIGDWVKSHGH